ncbi:hypothetical protein ACQEVB_16810 [Pseudonocardia sp. CA-107938]|uniref:hypothetical protein n=1 Tax=Pseudonocardia sp. CA-107938 TaxID=3240021 RepID=UPI003D91A002
MRRTLSERRSMLRATCSARHGSFSIWSSTRLSLERRTFVANRSPTILQAPIGLLRVGPVVADAENMARGLRGLVQVELFTDDLDGLYQELLARGLPVRPPRTGHGNGR